MKEVFKYVIAFIAIILAMIFINYKMEGDSYREGNDYTLNVVRIDTFWIYEINKKDTLFIRQEFIPAVQGKQVFKSKKDAETIGRIVLRKLSSNKLPMITLNDIKSNKIIFNDI